MYLKRHPLQRVKPRKPRPVMGLMGLGFSDEDQCSTIPIGDSYRRPGNYCATPDGGTTTFNADGSTYRAPGAVDPDPAHPPGMTSSSGEGGSSSVWNSIANILSPPRPGAPPVVPQSGMSTTTMIALAGGAVLLAVLLSK